MRIGPISIERPGIWVYRAQCGDWVGIFRNRREVKPGRWGFYFLGFEFGSRNPGNKFGVWLKNVGIWRW